MLARVGALPISTWSYRDDDVAVRHIGPTAQDFHAAFGLGGDDTAIATVDADGISLAAIQALERRIREQDARIEQLEHRNAGLLRASKHSRAGAASAQTQTYTTSTLSDRSTPLVRRDVCSVSAGISPAAYLKD